MTTQSAEYMRLATQATGDWRPMRPATRATDDRCDRRTGDAFWYHLHVIAGLDTKKGPHRDRNHWPITRPALKQTRVAKDSTASEVKNATYD
jgi:hypothetical protein